MNRTKHTLRRMVLEALLTEAPPPPQPTDADLDPANDPDLAAADVNTPAPGAPATDMAAPGGMPGADAGMGADPNAMDPNAMGADPMAGGMDMGMGGGMDMGMGAAPGGMGGSMDMGMGGGMPGMDQGQQQQQNTSILKYNQQLNVIDNIKFQRKEKEPGMDFKHFNEYIKDNYFAKTDGGSSVFPIPEKGKETKNFIEKVAAPYTLKTVNNALNKDKKVVFLSPEKLAYSNGKYSKDIYGYLAHEINSEFKDKVSFDVWNSADTDKFFSDKKFWSELENRSGSNKQQIRAALYLYFKYSGKDVSVASKLGGESTIKTLKKWGVYEKMMSGDEIKKTLYPEAYDQPQTQASMILKSYKYLSQLEFLKKIIKYEKLGYVVVAPTTKDIAWKLNETVKNLDKLKKLKSKQQGQQDQQMQPPGMEQGQAPPPPQPMQ